MEQLLLKFLATALCILLYITFAGLFFSFGYLGIFLIFCLSIFIIWINSRICKTIDKSFPPKPTQPSELVDPNQEEIIYAESSPPKRVVPEHIANAYKERKQPHSLVTCIWAYTDLFMYDLGIHLILHKQTYLWTAYFYVATKIIRKQSTVDQIRSTLGEESKYYFDTRFRGVEPYLIIQNSYRAFRTELNDSNIDPRTSDGRNELWDILLPRLSISPEIEIAAKKIFIAHTLFITYITEKMYIRNTEN